MGLFDAFKNTSAGRYVSEERFRKNLAKQLSWTPQTMEQLRKHGVTSDKIKKVEFFFYSNTLVKVQQFASALNRLGYDVETGQAAGKKNSYIATGWTVPISMEDNSMREWTQHMCTVGFEHDCDFDGWGTTTD